MPQIPMKYYKKAHLIGCEAIVDLARPGIALH